MYVAPRLKTGGSGFDLCWDPRKSSCELFFLSALISSGVHSACSRNEYQVISFGGKVQQTSRAENSAVKVKMETQNFFPSLSLHDLLGKPLHLFYRAD